MSEWICRNLDVKLQVISLWQTPNFCLNLDLKLQVKFVAVDGYRLHVKLQVKLKKLRLVAVDGLI